MDLSLITPKMTSIFDESYSLFLLCPKCTKHIPHISLIQSTSLNTIQVKIQCICTPLTLTTIDLIDYIKLIKKSYSNTPSSHCTINDNHFNRPSVIYCSFCHSWLCQECFLIHNKSNANHIILRQEIFLTCIDHKPKKLKLYCNDCKRSICKKCHSTNHLKHNIDPIEAYDSSNIERLLNTSAKIDQTMKVNSEIKNAFVKTVTTTVNQLMQWMSDIETVYRVNEDNNKLLLDYVQVIINTWAMTKEVPNYELKQTINEIQSNSESISKKLKWSTLEQYHMNLSQLLRSQLALKMQLEGNGNVSVFDKKNKGYINVISNERELENWELVLFNQENRSGSNVKPMVLSITNDQFEIERRLVKDNIPKDNKDNENDNEVDKRNMIEDKNTDLLTQPNVGVKQKSSRIKSIKSNHNSINKTIENKDKIVISKAKIKHQSIDNTTSEQIKYQMDTKAILFLKKANK